MNYELISNEFSEAFSQIDNKQDYLDVLLLFFERALIEKKYGKIKDVNHFNECRAEMYKVFCNYSCSPIFRKPIINQKYKIVFDIFNGTNNNIHLSDLGYIFEDYYNQEIDEKTGKLIASSSRKKNGMFFSNKELVSFIIRIILSENKNIAKKTFADPSMGSGIFLFELIEQVLKFKSINIIEFIENNVYGIDKNPYVVDIFKISVWIMYPDVDLYKLSQHIVCFDSLITSITGSGDTWTTIFPDVFEKKGFDCIIGNPPWGKIKANIRDYNLYYNTLSDDYQGKRMKEAVLQHEVNAGWEKYKKEISRYSRLLSKSSNFKNQRYEIDGTLTGGNADLYKYFLEQSFYILKKGGILGYIIPSSFYMNEGATGLRHLFLENGYVCGLYSFENKKHIFPIHPSYKFSIMLYKKTGKPGVIKNAIFDLIDPCIRKEKIEGVSYTIDDLSMCSGQYWTVPECHSQKELELLKKLYSYKCAGGTLKVGFKRELDMTLDSDIFVLEEEKDLAKTYLPLYEGRMIKQYNSYSKKYVSGNGRTAKWEKVSMPNLARIRSHYYVDKMEIDKRNINTGYRAAYCDVTGQKNVRTVLSTLIPKGTVCGNKVPTIEFENNDLRFALLWIGIANSFVIDWLIRRKMSITLNFFHWSQIPFPWQDIDGDIATTICAATAQIITKKNGIILCDELSGVIKSKYLKYKTLDEEDLRSIIDIAVADMYDLNIYELALVLYDFCALDQNVKGIVGDLRYGSNKIASYATRDKVLSDYIIAHNLEMDDIIDIYRMAGVDISNKTSHDFHSIKSRIVYYKKNGILAYTD